MLPGLFLVEALVDEESDEHGHDDLAQPPDVCPERLSLEGPDVPEDVVVEAAPVGGDVAEAAVVAAERVRVPLEVLVVAPGRVLGLARAGPPHLGVVARSLHLDLVLGGLLAAAGLLPGGGKSAGRVLCCEMASHYILYTVETNRFGSRLL